MPIFAITLSSPASRALRYRGAASSPTVANARYGCTAVAPIVIRHATSCTSTASPAMATMSVAMRRPVARRCECTAPTASAMGTGRRCHTERRSLSATTPGAASASRHKRSSASRRDSSGEYVASSTVASSSTRASSAAARIGDRFAHHVDDELHVLEAPSVQRVLTGEILERLEVDVMPLHRDEGTVGEERVVVPRGGAFFGLRVAQQRPVASIDEQHLPRA